MSNEEQLVPLDGPELITRVEDALLGARLYIYVAAWMLHFDLQMGKYSLIEILKMKAEEGVDVRILLSDLDPTMRLTVSDRAKLQIIERWEKRRIRQIQTTGVKVHLSTLKARGPIVGWLAAIVSESMGYSMQLAAHHQKCVVVDGRIGFCLGSDLVKLIAYPDRYHESAVMVKGPAVASLRSVFSDRWNAEAVRAGFDPITRQRDKGHSEIVSTLRTIPRTCFPTKEVLRAYCTAIDSARKSIYILNQYFREPRIAAALIAAIRRGVDVRIVLPDLPNEIHAGNGILKALGDSVSIYSQYRVLRSLVALEPECLTGRFARLDGLNGNWPSNLSIMRPAKERDLYIHSKVMVMDERLTLIGSANLNGRSMNGKCDTELNLLINDAVFSTQLKSKLELSLDDPGLVPYDHATLDRDEHVSRIDSDLLEGFTSLARNALSQRVPSVVHGRAGRFGQNWVAWAARRLHASDTVAFRDRLTNLTANYI